MEKKFARQTRFIICLIFFLIAGNSIPLSVNSQVVFWELSAEPGNQASSAGTNNSPNFTNSGLSRGAGITATAGAGSINSSGWFAGSTATTLNDAIANNDYYEFTINTINCLFFNPTTINIVLRSSATGPNTATLRCSSDGFTANIGTVGVGTTSAEASFSETISPNSQSVTYRLYGYGGAAGGGTPAAGGTMRIGTSVVATDNDLEVFATSTLISVSQVSNIAVTDGDAVPATVFTANVPGSTISWSRTPEDIAQPNLPLNGTGDLPAFTAENFTGSPITTTVTVTATANSCTSVNMVFTITVNPAPCTINVSFSGNPSACNDNGTPSDPSDDFYTQNVHASFFNRPSTGSLQIVPGGDVIGTYSILAQNIVGNSHTFNNVMFRADGNPTDVQMNFTDEPTCIDGATRAGITSCSAQDPCTINVSFSGNPSACNDNGTPGDPSDDFYTQNVHASFFNRPFTGSLQIVPGGDVIGTYSILAQNIVGNSHTFNNVMFRADGNPTDVQMNFTDEPTCIDGATRAGIASCSAGGTCDLNQGMTFSNNSACNNNGTPASQADDFFTSDVQVFFANPPATGNLVLNGPGVATAVSVPVGSLNSSSFHTFVAAQLVANGNANIITATFDANGGTCTGSATGPAIGSCSAANPPTITCPAPVTVSCASAVPPVNIAAVSETHSCPGNAIITHVSDVVSNQTCANRFTITRTYRVSDACGNTADCTQLITVNDQTPPVLSCPAPITVSCASAVPAANIAAVTGESDNCGGTVTITHQGDVISNQTCANRFTITRTYRATDACGNFTECTQIITVNDQTPPVLTCPAPITVSCASAVPAASIAAVTGVSDNCGGTVTITHQGDVIANQTCTNRFIITRTYRATDACGNFAECTQIITVNDQTPPVMTCPAPVTVSCASAVPAPNIAAVTGVSDNCGGTVTVTHISDVVSNQTCANRFTVTRTYRATDICGNFSQCTQIITVNDITPPVITCPAAVTVSCASAVPAVNTAAVTATDNCAGAITITHVSDVISNQSCANRFTVTRTYRATDICGNFSQCTQVITVNDQTAPVITCPANITATTPAGSCVAVVNFTPTATDNCGGAITIVSVPASGSAFPIGNNTVTSTATDACGNSSVCTFTITVLDGQLPVITAQPATRTVCEGTNTTFSVTAITSPNANGPIAYQWQQWNGTAWVNISGATASSFIVNNVTIAMNTNTFRVVLTGLCSVVNSSAATLFVNQLPSVSITTTALASITPGQTTNIVATATPAGGSYAWQFNGSPMSGVTGPTIGPLDVDDIGTYAVIYTDPNGCVRTSNSLAVTGVASENAWVYPNPNKGQFVVRFFNQLNEPATIMVYNSIGQLVRQRAITTGITYSRTDIDLGISAPGIYIVKVIGAGGRELAAKRIVVR